MSYVEKCREYSQGVKIEVLAGVEPVLTGKGGSYLFYSLGKLTVGEPGTGNFGIKVPRRGMSGFEVQMEFARTVAFIEYVARTSPDFLNHVSNFMTMVSLSSVVENEEPVSCIIMEDFSKSREKSVLPTPANDEMKSMFYSPFSEAGSMSQVLDDDTLEKTTCFSVDGRQMALDFTPLPIKYDYLKGSATYRSLLQEIFNNINDFTVKIPQDSALGLAITT